MMLRRSGARLLFPAGPAHGLILNMRLKRLLSAGCDFALFHCVSEYPCPDDHVNLGMIHTLKEKFYGVEIGYSNHSPGIESCVGAAYLGVGSLSAISLWIGLCMERSVCLFRASWPGIGCEVRQERQEDHRGRGADNPGAGENKRCQNEVLGGK